MAVFIEVSFQKMDNDDESQKYLEQKVNRFSELLDKNAKVRGIIRRHETRNYFTVSLNIDLVGGVIWVEEKDEAIRAAIDKAADLLEVRIKRYKSKHQEWRGKQEWKHTPVPEEEAEPSSETVHYVPRVKTVNRFRSERSISVGEAIERMELASAPCYLFRDLSNDRWAVVCRLEDNLYGITHQSE